MGYGIKTRAPVLKRVGDLLVRLLPAGSLKRQAAILTTGTVIAQAITVLSSPLLTRLYTSSDIGHLQVYLSISGFFLVIASLRYETAILLPDKDETAANLVAFSMIATIGLALLLLAGVIHLRGTTLFAKQLEGIRPYIYLMPVSMCGAGFYQILSAWALRKKNFRSVANTRVTQTLTSSTIQLSTGAMHLGVFGLLLGEAAGRVNGSLSLMREAWKRDNSVFRAIRPQEMWAAGMRYRRFPLISVSSSLINTAAAALPTLLIATWFGSSVVGYYAMADRITAAFFALLCNSISQVYLASAATLVEKDPVGLRRLFVQMLKKLILLSVPVCLVIVLIGPWSFAKVFGNSWREAGVYAQLLCITAWVGFVSSPLMPTLNIFEKQTLQLVWDIGRTLLTCGGPYLAHKMHASPRVVVFVYGLAMMLGYACHLLLSYLAILDNIRKHRDRQAIQGSDESGLSH
ncbi:MAG: lipopolysaccharide biosynthesis protein [Armatimonadota bacterium]